MAFTSNTNPLVSNIQILPEDRITPAIQDLTSKFIAIKQMKDADDARKMEKVDALAKVVLPEYFAKDKDLFHQKKEDYIKKMVKYLGEGQGDVGWKRTQELESEKLKMMAEARESEDHKKQVLAAMQAYSKGGYHQNSVKNFTEFMGSDFVARQKWDYANKPLLIPEYDFAKTAKELGENAPEKTLPVEVKGLRGATQYTTSSELDEKTFDERARKTYQGFPPYAKEQMKEDEYVSLARLYYKPTKPVQKILKHSAGGRQKELYDVTPVTNNGKTEWNFRSKPVPVTGSFTTAYDSSGNATQDLSGGSGLKKGLIGKVVMDPLNLKGVYAEVGVPKAGVTGGGAQSLTQEDIDRIKESEKVKWEAVNGPLDAKTASSDEYKQKIDEAITWEENIIRVNMLSPASGGGMDPKYFDIYYVPYNDVAGELKFNKINLLNMGGGQQQSNQSSKKVIGQNWLKKK